jgi:hypothetical protein
MISDDIDARVEMNASQSGTRRLSCQCRQALCLTMFFNGRSALLSISILMLAVHVTTAAALPVSDSGLPPDVVSVFDLDSDITMASTAIEPALQSLVADTTTGKV